MKPIGFSLNCLLLMTLLLGASFAEASSTVDLHSSSLDSLLLMPVSTTERYKQKQTEAPAFVTVINQEEIRRLGYRTLEEVLRAQIGFYSGYDHSYSDVGFRGFGSPGSANNKILLLLDGHTLNDNFTGGVRLGTAQAIDLDAIERIEIVRGPGSTLYGARAMLAVVNLVSRKGRHIDGLELTAEAGSAEALGTKLQYGRVLGEDRDLAVAVSWATREGEDLYFPEMDFPALNDGVAKQLDWGHSLRGLATLRYGHFEFQALFAQREKGIPTGAFSTVFNHPEAETSDRLMFGEVRYQRTFDSSTELVLRGYTDHFEHVSVHPIAITEYGSQQIKLQGLKSQSRSFGSELRVRWDPALNLRLVSGVEVQRILQADHETTLEEMVQASGDHPYSIFSGFVHQELQITPRLSLMLGIRRDHYTSQGSSTTPRSALIYHHNRRTTLKFMAGEAFRAPNIDELYISAPDATILSNPGLESERIRSYEAIWEQDFGPLTLTCSIFHNQFRRLIDLVQVEIPDTLGHSGTYAFQHQNVDDARSAGFETELRISLPGNITTRVGYGMHDASNEYNLDRLVNSPKHLLRLDGSWDVDGWAILGLSCRAESSRRTLFGTKTDSHQVLDASVSSSSRLARWHVQLLLKNLLDAEYSVPGGVQHVQPSLVQPGRTFTLRVGIRL